MATTLTNTGFAFTRSQRRRAGLEASQAAHCPAIGADTGRSEAARLSVFRSLLRMPEKMPRFFRGPACFYAAAEG